jgi:protein-S-isoprenylcysteine O-methyltransferase Ste14
MKAYLITTGSVFALVVLAHVARMIAEPRLVREPTYLLLTLAAAVLSAWSWRLLRRSPPSSTPPDGSVSKP